MLRPFIIALVATTLLSACAAPKHTPPDTIDITLDQVLEKQNTRTAALNRLWARASVQVIGRDASGGRLSEQAGGHLQIEAPDRVALSLGKVGKVQLYLGSNTEFYWWIDMVDRDNKSVIIGRHDKVTAQKAQSLGVPIYPRDLIKLLGITPIDSAAVMSELAAEGKRLVLDTRLDAGHMKTYFDARTLDPVRVEMFDPAGTLLVASDLTRYDFVSVQGDATTKPRVPEKIVLTLTDGTTVRISLYAPENKPIRPSAFDLERLVRGYHIDRIYDLDNQAQEQQAQEQVDGP
jgi:hypothetical protein